MHPVLFHIGALVIPSYGALAAIGVLAALLLAQRTARTMAVSPVHIWNLCVVALFAALLGSRLLLVVVNWRELLRHPLWILGLATIHHPLLAAAGVAFGLAASLVYIRWYRLSFAATLDALAVPLVVGMAFEQLGALLAGAGFGTETSVRWAVIYTSPLAARWSGAPLGVPVHPVQAYAALAYATLAVLLLIWFPARRQSGDIAGVALLGAGITMYITEFWRDPEGRGQLLHGALDAPQVAALVLVIAGGLLLLDRKGTPKPTPGTATPETTQTTNEAAHG
jgi:phosphatidylglycerol:prolipoprotein diacylglycerol transferase